MTTTEYLQLLFIILILALSLSGAIALAYVSETAPLADNDVFRELALLPVQID